MTTPPPWLPADLAPIRELDQAAPLGRAWEVSRPDGSRVAVQYLYDRLPPPRYQDEIRRVWDLVETVDDVHLVRFLHGSLGPPLWATFELVTGCTSVQDELERGPTTIEAAVDIVRQAVAGLVPLHAVGLSHQLVDPPRLLRASPTTIKLSHAWFAPVLRAIFETETRTGWGLSWSVAYQYIPPETSGRALVDRRPSDIYSLGAIAYHALAGTPPFGEGETMMHTIMAHVEKPVPALPTAVPSRLAQLVVAMLAKAPADRPTAAEVSAAVDQLA